MIGQNKAYEQARDDAAKKEYKELGVEYQDHNIAFFKEGSDFGFNYSQNLNADLLADNKLMKETLELISSPSEWNCEIGESNQRAAAVKTLSQLKGKYND